MENSIKAIIIGATIVITLVIVSIGFLVLRQGQDTAKLAINKIDKMNSELSETEYTMYDGLEVSGSEVVNILKKFEDEYVGIQVITGKKASGTWYIHDGESGELSNADGDIPNTYDETNKEYINPNGRFIGKVERDDNGSIIALKFEQK